MRRTLSILPAVLLVTLATPLASQSLERNAQGDWVLAYTDLDGAMRTLVIEAMDQVAPALAVQLSGSGGAYTYQYVLTNGATARRTIHVLDLLCPAGDPTLTVGALSSWYAKADTNGRLEGAPGGLLLCSYTHRPGLPDQLTPGGVLSGLQVASTWLPGIRTARVYGLAQTPALPTAVEETPDTVLKLLERANGFVFFNGGGLALLTVVPARSSAALAAPGTALDSVAADLAQVCSLGWISVGSACTSLGVQLSQARDAVAQGNTTAARTAVESFLSQLNAQHGAGLPVNDNAYWLLKVNAEFILSHLGQTTTPMCFGTAATIYVQNGVIVGGPHNGQTYTGTLDGTSGNDVIVGTDARDIVEAGSGADKVCGMGGDDLIKGQGDADQLDGGDGNDAIEGGPGNDVIQGGGGNDLLKGQDGIDTVSGGDGNDTIEGGPGDDDLDGGPGTDTIKGQGGTDRCRNGETVETCETS